MTRPSPNLMAAAFWGVCLTLGLTGGAAHALDPDLSTRKGQATAALAALGYGVAPSPYSSLLFVEQTEQGNSNFRNGQFGGRIPVDTDPLYLEAYFAFQRYAPVVGVPATGEDVTVQWRSYSGTG
ncbi:MAG: hypothetical protein AAGH83_11470, partial [Pseudomonadota bacterium]